MASPAAPPPPPAHTASSSSPAAADEEEPVAELTTFSSSEAYVYAPLPPAPHYGHRAELWDVNKWLSEVKVRVVMRREDCFVRMESTDTGELFAECPLPSDGTPLTTAVESVVDSSRYFVVRVVDRGDPKKHAFVGLGFRERGDASDFTAALDDYRQLVRRSQEAEAMRARFEGLATSSSGNGGGGGGEASGGGGGGGAAGGSGGEDLRLRESITLKISAASIKKAAGGEGGRALKQLSGSHLTPPAAAVVPAPAGGFKLAPPPPPSGSKVSAGAANAASAAVPAASTAAAAAPPPAAAAAPAPAAAAAAAAPAPAAPAAVAAAGEVQEDDWAVF